MTDLGKSLILIGGLIVLIGLAVSLLGKIPGLGKLPGDILIKKENITLYFPLATCILLSLIISILMHFFGKK